MSDPGTPRPEPTELRPFTSEQELARRREQRNARRARARRARRAVLGALAAAGAAALVYAWMPRPIEVNVVRVARGSLDVFVEEDGRTRVRERFVVNAPLSGMLARVEVEPGDRIAEGDVVARVAPPHPLLLDERGRAEAASRLDAALAQARQADAAAERARAARDFAGRDASRAERLAREQALTAAERERAELQDRVAAQDLAAAELQRQVAAAQVASARAVLGTLRRGGAEIVEVTAPTGGVVLRVLRESQGAVAVGTPLVEIGNPTRLEVVVDVLSADAPAIAAGAPVWVEAWGGEGALLGRVRRVEPSAFTRVSALGVEEQRVDVVVSLGPTPAELGDHYRVETRIRTWRGDGILTIPSSGAFRDGDGWAVYAARGGRARRVPIEVGHRGRLDLEVTGGLAEGDLVVLYPDDRIGEGSRIKPR